MAGRQSQFTLSTFASAHSRTEAICDQVVNCLRMGFILPTITTKTHQGKHLGARLCFANLEMNNVGKLNPIKSITMGHKVVYMYYQNMLCSVSNLILFVIRP